MDQTAPNSGHIRSVPLLLLESTASRPEAWWSAWKLQVKKQARVK